MHADRRTGAHLQRAVGVKDRVEELSDLADEPIRLPVLRRHNQL